MISTQSALIQCGHQATRIVLVIRQDVKAGWTNLISTLPVNSATRTLKEQRPVFLLCNIYMKHLVLHISQKSWKRKNTFIWKWHLGIHSTLAHWIRDFTSLTSGQQLCVSSFLWRCLPWPERNWANIYLVSIRSTWGLRRALWKYKKSARYLEILNHWDLIISMYLNFTFKKSKNNHQINRGDGVCVEVSVK